MYLYSVIMGIHNIILYSSVYSYYHQENNGDTQSQKQQLYQRNKTVTISMFSLHDIVGISLSVLKTDV